ncbi:class I SAM-dependent methyltransferase [Microbacterium sp. p3-SID338]|uniref:class I SAM-dependent methyltransferase n=1 Tax=unclassified Microbacterium TaxID=2609290 RepID=UPI000C80E86B|nr:MULTISPECIES: class I SAM-dependent methyltransferase [unclassified Microbacterium]MCT1394258.1 class I SAM-dependent methyltransferase [Microbacterium sp. p3-SID338]PMC03312.1 SAM-dependent methyltransferase [Microbacterium sp. UMB0228]
MVDVTRARSFESIGEEYDRYRPGFPERAADIIVPDRVATALDLGAGTGKFTGLLVARATRVIAIEPSAPMLAVLARTLPTVDALLGTAESIPVPDGSVDAVSVAQAFHWFDRDTAAAQIARTLVPHGTLGLLWNRADPACAWDLACHRVAHPAVGADDDTSASATDLPGFVLEIHEEVRWTERITREDYLRRWGTVSSFLVADEAQRTAMVAALEAVLDGTDETRGKAEFDLPHLTDVFRYRRA